MICMDRLADAINVIKTNERMGRDHCIVGSTRIIKSVLEVLKRESYIQGYEEFKDGKFMKLRIALSNKINSIGVIKPRYAIKKDMFQKYESRYIPSRDFGMLIVSTPHGMLTNKEARAKLTGGRLVLYVY